MVLMVPVVLVYLWLHGTYGSMVPVAVWSLWLLDTCLHAPGLIVKYLLSNLLLMPININILKIIFCKYFKFYVSNFLFIFLKCLTVLGFKLVLVAPWYLSTCTRFNCKVPSVFSVVNAHS